MIDPKLNEKKKIRLAQNIRHHILPYFGGMEGEVLREAMDDWIVKHAIEQKVIESKSKV